MKKESSQENITYLAILLLMSKADGEIDLWEEKFIDDTARKLGIDEAEKDMIKSNPQKYCDYLPNCLNERLSMFYNLLVLMGIDGTIDENEKEMCRAIGFRLCFNPMLMEDMIQIMIEHIGKKVPVEQVVEAVIKYQN